MSKIFRHLLIDASIGLLVFGGTATACSEKAPPEPVKTQHTDERGMPIEKPIPTGCKGKITSRLHDEASGTFAITYYTDAKCSATSVAIISEEDDLNMTCFEGDYWDQCTRPDETEPPGIRQPTEPAS